MTSILELNDADLTLYRDNEVLHRSPGIAVVLGKQIHFGEDALRLSRIHPRQTNQQYFTRLNADPLAVTGDRARNHADLVYLHLKLFKPFIDAEGGAVVLAVPGILSGDQLGVLLGVLQEVGIEVAGFVDAAVAAVANQDAPGQTYFLDVMMQRAIVTSLSVDTDVRKTAVQEVQECGLNRLLEGWINVIADRFVRETRFDPLHAAASEQQLFDQVYGWINSGAEGSDLVVGIDHHDHTRRTEVARGTLEDKGEQRFRQLSDALPRGAHVFVSARSARLPGLARALAALHVQAVPLPASALTRGCLGNLDQILPRGGELRLVTRLPHGSVLKEVARPTALPTQALDNTPTHVLHGHQAVSLAAAAGDLLPIVADGQGFTLRAEPHVRLNGAPLREPVALRSGDRVTIGQDEYLIIHVKR
jgi:hypothetical protein